MNYTILKTELLTDPKALGYAPHITSGKHFEIVTLMNNYGGSGETVPREVIESYEVTNAIVYSEWVALTADQKNYLNLLNIGGRLDASNTNVKTALLAIFGAGTTTRANLVALATRPAARSEVLFGRGVLVNSEQIAIALRS